MGTFRIVGNGLKSFNGQKFALVLRNGVPVYDFVYTLGGFDGVVPRLGDFMPAPLPISVRYGRLVDVDAAHAAMVGSWLHCNRAGLAISDWHPGFVVSTDRPASWCAHALVGAASALRPGDYARSTVGHMLKVSRSGDHARPLRAAWLYPGRADSVASALSPLGCYADLFVGRVPSPRRYQDLTPGWYSGIGGPGWAPYPAVELRKRQPDQGEAALWYYQASGPPLLWSDVFVNSWLVDDVARLQMQYRRVLDHCVTSFRGLDSLVCTRSGDVLCVRPRNTGDGARRLRCVATAEVLSVYDPRQWQWCYAGPRVPHADDIVGVGASGMQRAGFTQVCLMDNVRLYHRDGYPMCIITTLGSVFRVSPDYLGALFSAVAACAADVTARPNCRLRVAITSGVPGPTARFSSDEPTVVLELPGTLSLSDNLSTSSLRLSWQVCEAAAAALARSAAPPVVAARTPSATRRVVVQPFP